MSRSLMMQDEDNERIENLKKQLHIRKKIDVIRAALDLLEKEAKQQQKIKRWKQAAKLVAKNSEAVNKEFQPHLCYCSRKSLRSAIH